MHRRRAFTLVELLVVIGIIALLISVLLPALNRAREASSSVKCMSNIRQLAVAFLMYTQDNKGKFPTSARGNVTSPYLDEDWIYWQPGRDVTQARIVKYLGHFKQEVFLCPSDDIESHRAVFPPGNPTRYPFSYTMNKYYNSESMGMNPNVATNNYYPGLRVSNVRSASEKVLIIEEDDNVGNTLAAGSNDALWDPGTLTGLYYTGDMLSVRHQRRLMVGVDVTTAAIPVPNRSLRGNVGFIDGHAEFATREFAQNVMHVQPLYPTME